jgi:hypothetical protein
MVVKLLSLDLDHDCVLDCLDHGLLVLITHFNPPGLQFLA